MTNKKQRREKLCQNTVTEWISGGGQSSLSSPRGKSGKLFAFTLAEVLITLGIIGVVAAMIMPTILQKYEEKVTVIKLKKAYNIVSQAFLRAEQENGDIGTWGFDTNSRVDSEGNYTNVVSNNEDYFWTKLVPYMNVTEVCYLNEGKNCTDVKNFKLNGEVANSKDTTVKLSDGITFRGAWIQSPRCPANTYCGDFFVDINGIDKAPNTIGKDVFYFIIMKNKIVPWGNDETKFQTRCLDGDGYGCTAWVLFNENLDYLHCKDLSWNGKKSCK